MTVRQLRGGLAFCLLSAAALASLGAGDAPPSLDRSGTQWAPALEWSLPNPTFRGNPYDLEATATFVHADSGEKHTTGMFYAGKDAWKFRFAATRPGRWAFATASDDDDLDDRRGTVTVKPNPDAYGFVSHAGSQWVRPRGAKGEPEAFVPQFVMYSGPHVFHNKPKMIDADIRTFLDEHGFTGFHVPVLCRWFDIDQPSADGIKSDDPNPDPRTFEALELLITKVHAAGGVVHLWAWGDEQRHMTPKKWGINGRVDKRLQRYLAARLGPLPGWTMGYGFDLWEWTDGKELTAWHDHLHDHFGWPHLLGARSEKNKFSQLSEALDYSAYEQHRPDYDTYVKTIQARPKKPSFSEDRFRIRQSKQHAHKDYTMEMTRQGLWRSAMAGGVANIWGNLQGDLKRNAGKGGSLPYPKPHWIKTYARFFEKRFLVGMNRDNDLTDGVCLCRPEKAQYLFYKENADSIQVDLRKMRGRQPVVAVDAKKSYAEIELGKWAPRERTWKAPYRSDWAIAVGGF